MFWTRIARPGRESPPPTADDPVSFRVEVAGFGEIGADITIGLRGTEPGGRRLRSGGLGKGTIHCDQRAVDRLQRQFPNLTLVHVPKHASWLNQIETYFSILRRKALTPAHFTSQDEVAQRILGFQDHYQQIASPFEWPSHAETSTV